MVFFTFVSGLDFNTPPTALAPPWPPVLTPMRRILCVRIIATQSNLRAKWSARLQWVPKDVDVWRGILAVRSLVLKPREVGFCFWAVLSLSCVSKMARQRSEKCVFFPPPFFSFVKCKR